MSCTLKIWYIVFVSHVPFYSLQLVFDTPTKGPFTKMQAGIVVGGGVLLGIGIVVGAVAHQQIKHGEDSFRAYSSRCWWRG